MQDLAHQIQSLSRYDNTTYNRAQKLMEICSIIISSPSLLQAHPEYALGAQDSNGNVITDNLHSIIYEINDALLNKTPKYLETCMAKWNSVAHVLYSICD